MQTEKTPKLPLTSEEKRRLRTAKIKLAQIKDFDPESLGIFTLVYAFVHMESSRPGAQMRYKAKCILF